MRVDEVLANRGLFEVSYEAKQKLGELNNEFLENIYTTAAAEVEVIQQMISSGSVKTLPLNISGPSADMAIVKFGCNLSDIDCLNVSDGIEFVYLGTGDLVKAENLFDGDSRIALAENVDAFVARLEDSYQQGGTRLGRQMVDSGALRLEALLWRARLHVLRANVDETVALDDLDSIISAGATNLKMHGFRVEAQQTVT